MKIERVRHNRIIANTFRVEISFAELKAQELSKSFWAGIQRMSADEGRLQVHKQLGGEKEKK